MTAAVTLSIAGFSYSQFDARELERKAQVVADKATCRAVNSAIVAYVGINGNDPKAITDLNGYLDGDISSYRVVRGRAAGPGCA
ncbi:hypothetical protein [Paractinoplanes lichenicola]|uniref:hypothetical protein n=1 Tax=Paractinoplanes lichenicola TaxID=2802976 RepID=UPI001F1A0871|nr:hypothetical protein [Actinoplanes lichenicola]